MDREEEYSVPKEKALDHAATRMLIGVVTKTPGLEGWKGATVNPQPLVIHDINGKLLFFEFSVEKAGKIVGRLKASASKVLGPAVYTAEIGPRLWDADKAAEQAKKIAQKKFRNATIMSTQLVCYSYPKLGIMVVMADPKTKEETGRIVVDVASFEIVPEAPTEEDTVGIGIWSMYDSIPQKDRRDRISRWEADDKLQEFVKNEAKKLKISLRARLSERDFGAMETALGKVLAKRLVEKKVSKGAANPSFSTGKIQLIEIPWIIEKRIQLTLHGQQHCVWCACASGQMILQHHRYCYEQIDIATAMGTAWSPDSCGGGTSYNGIVNGMESLSRNYLDAVRLSPTWSWTKSEIDQDQPLVSCIPGHARACSGYRRFNWLPWLPWPIHRHLYIYDPWPPDANNTYCDPHGGAEYWEDWDVTTYWDFVHIRPCKGTMICQT
jgi:hypothetical protein